MCVNETLLVKHAEAHYRLRMSPSSETPQRDGIFAAVGAYLIWGFLPLYLILVRTVPAVEFVGWRILWTLPLCLLIAGYRHQISAIAAALRSPTTLAWLALSATLIGINWLIYVWAIQSGNVYAASLGYYINPLLNVLLGTVLLKEKLSRPRWIAVALAGVGVAILATGALTTLWISLSLALSFGFYGLVRKRVDVGAIPGLTIELALLAAPSVAIVYYYAQTASGSSFGQDALLSFYIILGGVVTAVPLLMFTIAARKMPYSTLGFIQFLAPSIVFILGLTVFGEKLETAEIVCFAFIWTAAAIFIFDLLRQPAARPA